MFAGDVTWVVLSDGGAEWACLRCEKTGFIALPVVVELYTAWCRQLMEEHAGCVA